MTNESATVKVRIRPSDKQLLELICDERGQKTADVLSDLVRQELAAPMLESFTGAIAAARRFVPDAALIHYTDGRYLALDERGRPYYRQNGQTQYLIPHEQISNS